MITEIDRVKCLISTERLRYKEVLDRVTGMVFLCEENNNDNDNDNKHPVDSWPKPGTECKLSQYHGGTRDSEFSFVSRV